MLEFIRKVQRGLRKPPRVIAYRIFAELKVVLARYSSPWHAKRFNLQKLLRATASKNQTELWSYLIKRPFPTYCQTNNLPAYKLLYPTHSEKILFLAKQALNHQVDLLGSGLIELGSTINWHKDYKSGYSWSPAYMHTIDYNNPDRPSDVKFPWEVSRMQWVIPVGQAYLLTGEEHYAEFAKALLSDWITQNPYAHSVNWSCTMEVALRVLTWTWFFHVFAKSLAWQDKKFQQLFLTSLFLHADFITSHLEYSDINGNHYTADAAGLVFAGLFFGRGKKPQKWHELGWKILNDELPKQVFTDGVDFEASVPYHRLVAELFLFPAFYRQACSMDIPAAYQQRLIAMGEFTAAYSRKEGSVPLWGDADDARALPFGEQAINDHRYLIGLIGAKWQTSHLLNSFSGSTSEIYWHLGPTILTTLNKHTAKTPLLSQAFKEGGFYIMRNAYDHIFIDCGPLGLAGRGGHGHNDCLAFEAVLADEHLITDCGAYLYTASYQDRNYFRSTAYHNTPQVNQQEINRFIRPDYLWNLHYDAHPIVHHWETTSDYDLFCGSHTGYKRLNQPLIPKRTLLLLHQEHSLMIKDEFIGEGSHQIVIPLHLAPAVKIFSTPEQNRLCLEVNSKSFFIHWENSAGWQFKIEEARVSPSYGVIVPSKKLLWEKAANIDNPSLIIYITPFPDLRSIMQRYDEILFKL